MDSWRRAVTAWSICALFCMACAPAEVDTAEGTDEPQTPDYQITDRAPEQATPSDPQEPGTVTPPAETEGEEPEEPAQPEAPPETPQDPPEDPADPPEPPLSPPDEPTEPPEDPTDPEEPEDPPTGDATVAACFTEIAGTLGPDYDQFEPVVGTHCKGTNHQDIDGLDRVVFLGDSVTAGTPPTPFWEYYSSVLGVMLVERFGAGLETQNCAEWGARTDDLLIGKKEIESCFPKAVDDRRTLVVMTIGGNDISNWAQNGLSAADAMAEADKAADLLEDAVEWFKEPGRFPNGIFVIVANPFEFTDATGDLSSCPMSAFAGLSGNWIEGAPAVIHLHERFMKIAVDHGIDLAFSLEHFCGHGYKKDDPSGQCYLGPDAELWFDLTCIHPNPAGHAAIADLFISIVDE